MSGRCLEGIGKVSERCLESFLNVIGSCLEGVQKVYRRSLEGVWNINGSCLKGFWKVSEGFQKIVKIQP